MVDQSVDFQIKWMLKIVHHSTHVEGSIEKSKKSMCEKVLLSGLLHLSCDDEL